MKNSTPGKGKWTFDPRTRIIEVSPEVYPMFMLDPSIERIDAEVVSRFFTQQQRGQFRSFAAEALLTGKVIAFTTRVTFKNGPVDFALEMEASLNRPGKVTHFFGTVRKFSEDQTLGNRPAMVFGWSDQENSALIRAPFSIIDIFDELAHLLPELRNMAGEYEKSVDLKGRTDVVALMNYTDFYQGVTCLTRQAVLATRKDRIILEVKKTFSSEGEWVEINAMDVEVNQAFRLHSIRTSGFQEMLSYWNQVSVDSGSCLTETYRLAQIYKGKFQLIGDPQSGFILSLSFPSNPAEITNTSVSMTSELKQEKHLLTKLTSK